MHIESSDSKPTKDDYVIISDKYRFVKPYHFDFVCNVKQRWEGRNIVDIFTQEFPAKDRSYYLQALASGKLRVEGKQIDADTPLHAGMRMRHLIHRHEPPVPAGSIQVLGETSELVIVSKPHGMPVHVSGQYRKNTVLGILNAERPDLGTLLPVHRLDKPVSGVLLFARQVAAANEMRRRIEGHQVEKIYVARVQGAFPASDEAMRIDVPLGWDPVANMAFAVPEEQGGQAQEEEQQADDEEEELTEGIKKRKRKARSTLAADSTVGDVNKCRDALTLVRLLSTAPDGRSSVVECRPLTGRTHQIRVHLAHAGFPIGNDTQYGGTFDGPTSARELGRQLGVLWGTEKCDQAQQPQDQNSAASSAEYGLPRALPGCTELVLDEASRDALCSHCPSLALEDYPVDMRPLWLHACCYSWQSESGADSFQAPLPCWAHKDWVPPPPCQ